MEGPIKNIPEEVKRVFRGPTGEPSDMLKRVCITGELTGLFRRIVDGGDITSIGNTV